VSRPLISIVVPVYNRLDLTRQCLDRIHETAADVAHEIVVIDNRSSDETAALLREADDAGRLRAILNPENLGFGRACNQGLAAARGEHVLFLNNDTIPRPGWLEPMLEELSDPAVGAVGSRLLYPDGTIQHCGIAFDEQGLPFHLLRGEAAEHPGALLACDRPAVTGACLLIRGSLVRQLGGFSASYRMYVEDIDLCFAVWDAGYRVRYCPESVVTHLENASVEDVAWRDARVMEGLATLRRRWAGRLPAAIAEECGPVYARPWESARARSGVAFAEELFAKPELLAGFARAVDALHGTTLVIVCPTARLDELAALVEVSGLAGESAADLLAVEPPLDPVRAAEAQFVLSEAHHEGVLGALPRYGGRTIAELWSHAA
jgi:GT2 family glycosyltransferase